MTTKQVEGQNQGQDNGQGNDPPADDFEAAFEEFADKRAEATETEPPPKGREEEDGDQGAGDTEKGAAKEEAAGAVKEEAGPADMAGKAQEKTDGGDEPPAGIKPEVWATASPDLKAVLRDQAKKIGDLEHADRSNRGRISALTRQHQQAPAKGAGTGGAAKPKSVLDHPDLKKAAEEYPEVIGGVTPAMKELDERTRRIEDALSRMSEKAKQDYYDSQQDELTKAHPDWQKVTADTKFGEWLTKQPQYVQEGIARNGQHIVNAFEAGDIIQRYKDQNGLNPNPSDPPNGGKDIRNIDTRRQRQLESGAAVGTKGPGGAAGPPNEFDGAFAHFAARKERRRA